MSDENLTAEKEKWWEPLIEEDGFNDWLCDNDGDWQEKSDALWKEILRLRAALAETKEGE